MRASDVARRIHHRTSLVPEPLTEAAWAPFGWLPVADTDPRDGEETVTFEWADAHVNLIGHARAEVPETAGGLRCEMLFRHDTHTQALMPLNVPAVIAVAPADVEFADAGGRPTPSGPSGSSRSSPWCCTGAPGTGARSRSRVPRSGSSTSRACATPRTTGCVDLAAKGLAVDVDLCRDGLTTSVTERASWQLDEAEDAEVVSATVAELVDAITAREAGPDADGRPTFTTTSPTWWVRGRVFGGMVVAQALNAAMQTVPPELAGPLAARLLPAPDQPGVRDDAHGRTACVTGARSAPAR